MHKGLYIISSVLLELLALYTLIIPYPVFLFIIIHSISSYLFSLFCYNLLPQKYKRKETVFFIFIVSFSLTILGYLGGMCLVLLLRKQKAYIPPVTESFSMEMVLKEDVKFSGRKFGEGAITQMAKAAHYTSRQETLMIGKDLKHPAVLKFIRSSLHNPSDEIRLYAFNLLARVEEEINSNIANLKEGLKKEKDRTKRAQIHSELARLYWEFVYMKITDKELEDINLEEAFFHIEEAMKVLDNPNVYLLAGRIYLRKGRKEKALFFLEKAYKMGIPASRVIPYIAEIYFESRNYTKIKEMFSKWDGLTLYPNLYFIYLFWNERLKDDG